MKLNKAYQDLFSLTSSNAVGNAVTFVSVMLLSRYVPAESFGVFSLCVTILMTASSVIDFGASVSLVRWYNYKNSPYRKQELIGSAAMLRLLSSAIFIILLFPVAEIVNQALIKEEDSSLASIALLAGLAMSWWVYFRSILQAQQKYRIYSIATIILSFIRVGFVAYCFISKDFVIAIYLAGLYLLPPTLVVACSFIKNFRRILRAKPFSPRSFSIIPALLKYGKWPFFSMILYPLVFNIPLWMLSYGGNFSSAGTYGIGVFFSAAIAPLREAVRVFLVPKVAAFASKEEAKLFLDKVVGRFIYVPLIAVVASVTAVLLQHLVNGEKYDGAYGVIIVFIAVQVITMYSSLIGSILHYLGKPEVDTTVNIIRVFLSAALAFALIPLLGAAGAAIAAGASTIFGEFVIYMYVKRQLI